MFAASCAMTGVAAASPPSNLVIQAPAANSQTNDLTPDVSFVGADAAEHVVLQATRASHPDDNWATVDSATADGDGTGELTDSTAITDPNDTVDLAVVGDSGGRDQIQIKVNVVPVFDGAHFSDGATVIPDDVAFSASSAIRGGDVALYIDGVLDADATTAADADGNISGTLVPSTELTPGSHTAFARTVDADGNESSDSTEISFKVSPPAPAFAALQDNDQLNQNQPALNVNVDPAASDVAVVEYDEDLDDYVTLDSTATITNGVATLTPTLADGQHQLELTQTVAGATSVLSDSYGVTVKTSAPVLDPFDDLLSNENTPWFSASNLLELNDATATAIKLYVDGHLAATDGNFGIDGDSLQADAPIADGDHTAYVTTVDDLGHESLTKSNTIAFAIDTNAPALPFAVAPADGSTVTTASPEITLHAEPGAIVHLLVDDMQDEGDRTADAEGNATFTLSAALADGTHHLYTWARDTAGNGSDVVTSSFVVKTGTVTPAPAAVTPAPVAPVKPIAPVTPITPVVVVAAPSKVSLSSHTLTADKPVKVGFTLKKAATLKVTITKVVKGKTVVVATVSVKAKAGTGSYTLKTKVGGKKLARGNYKVSLQTVSGKKTSKATATQKIKVG